MIYLSFFCCNPSVSEKNNINETNYGKIDDYNLQLKFGDVIQSEDGNIKAIVIDISNEDNKYFFGVSFMNDNQIFGRRIPEGFNGDCIDLVDVIYIEESYLINKFKILKHENLNFKKIGIGAYGYVNSYEEILSHYINDIKRRELEQTSCTDLMELNPVFEQYFDINQFK